MFLRGSGTAHYGGFPDDCAYMLPFYFFSFYLIDVLIALLLWYWFMFTSSYISLSFIFLWAFIVVTINLLYCISYMQMQEIIQVCSSLPCLFVSILHVLFLQGQKMTLYNSFSIMYQC